MGTLDNKVAVVTGAGRGIGREVALALSREGARIVVNDYGVTVNGTDPRSDVADAVVDEIRSIGGHAIAHQGSVVDMVSAEDMVSTAVREFGDLDVLVCVAGILRERMIFNMTEDEWDSVINVHLKGHFAPMHYATQHMRKQRKGRIISFTSAAGLEGNPGQANYAAAKAGIVGLAMSVALGMGKYGVTSNVVCPVADTRMTADLEKTPAGKLIHRTSDRSPHHVGALVAFLASDLAAHITGQIIEVEGRRLTRWSHFHPERTMVRDDEDWTVEAIAQAYDRSLGIDRLRRFEKMGLIEPGTQG